MHTERFRMFSIEIIEYPQGPGGSYTLHPRYETPSNCTLASLPKMLSFHDYVVIFAEILRAGSLDAKFGRASFILIISQDESNQIITILWSLINTNKNSGLLSHHQQVITWYSTWNFKIWLRFWKYIIPPSCEWNLYEYDRLVMKW